MNAVVAEKLRGRLLRDVSMARYSTWRAGGKVSMLFIPADQDDLLEFLAGVGQVPLHFIGLGSNLLVRDGGVGGVVIRLAPGLVGMARGAPGRLWAEAGVAAPKLARHAAKLGLGGAEFMVGIPGSVGGALVMNAGCFGSATWDIVAMVTVFSPGLGLQELPAAEFVAGYRKVTHPGMEQLLFVAGEFALEESPAEDATKMDELMRRRAATQPIGTANAGSVFINPPNEAAGRLIEAAGLAGHRIGEAEISPKHCNFIINRGAARASDIEELIGYVQATVREHSGIELQTEVRILGRKL